MTKLLIANRGEIALRIARTAADLGIATVAVYPADDAESLHVRAADQAVELSGSGIPAYLDIAQLVEVAVSNGCDAVHPGYGFLSESAEFCRACEAAGLAFVGPTPETLDLFGDKAAARDAAQACAVPILPGISEPVSLEQARAFLMELSAGGAVMLKALAGGGGRGMRVVESVDALDAAYTVCAAEAEQAFGRADLYVEELLPNARHIEVQAIGDGRGGVAHLWDRECSLQLGRQKLVEIAPAFGLDPELRAQLLDAAVRLGAHTRLRGLCTFEFLVDPTTGRFVFLEGNPRIQVEHTVTETVLGIDLVAAQLRIAEGATLAEIALDQPSVATPHGVAVQLRVNMERIAPDGARLPSGGTIGVYEPPSGPGVRVDGFGYAGYVTNPRYDSLLAKLIVHAPDLARSIARARRALAEFRLQGIDTNIALLRAILSSSALSELALHTRYIDQHVGALLAAPNADRPRFFVDDAAEDEPAIAGDPDDPLAVLSVGPGRKKPVAARTAQATAFRATPAGTVAIGAPMQGIAGQLLVAVGDTVARGQQVASVEALKMEHPVKSPVAGIVRELAASGGSLVSDGQPMLFVEPAEIGDAAAAGDDAIDLELIRPDLARVEHFRGLTRDAARAAAVAKRHASGKRTARENIADLCDADSFLEYGGLVMPARRHGETDAEIEARMLKGAADGLVMGTGRVNGTQFDPERARCAILSYDYTVFAGTQGRKNHEKTDRMLRVAEHDRLPMIFLTEGGGGRSGGYPGDPPAPPTTLGGLKSATWYHLSKLSALVPMIGIASGRCFAGNAVVLALCDVIIATRDSTLGIGGPAMIEGGGLGQFTPEEVGPVEIQEPNGVIDILVEDEAEAVAVAKRYLSYFQGRAREWAAPDQRVLRHVVPENRRAPFDVRTVIATIADEESMLEIRPRFGVAMVTAFIRIEGRPVGVVANNSSSPTGGAVDSDAADKAARFMQLCDAFDIPLITLLDVPGNMVGPEAEATATIRHCGRLYVTGGNLTVPLFSVVLRKAYGLGALAMTGGSFDVPSFVLSWPTGEFAGMGLEGQVKLGRRAELAAITDIPERKRAYEQMLARAYDWAGAVNGATVFEFDDVIDPADTRKWLAAGLEAAPAPIPRSGKKRPFVDTW